MNIITISITIILALVAISLVWRFTSARQSIPCPTWLGWLVELDNPFSTINRAASIIENSDLQPGMTILDAGCGPGRVTIPAAIATGTNGRVVAMDIQEGMLSRTNAKGIAANLTNIEFLQAGLGEGKLTASRFDRVLLVTVLGEIPDQQSAIKELFDALKPGGILSVTEIIFDPHFQRRSSVLRLAESVGFREKSRHGNCIAYTMLLEKQK